MANPLQTNGATLTKQTKYAPISVNRMFTGLWTQRNPLREAATPYLYEKFYSGARYDSIWDDGNGTFSKNVEVTNHLTLARRPGLSKYNTNFLRFNGVKGFYSFKWLDSTGTENISVIAASNNTTWDATGPDTKTQLYSGIGAKTAAQFQSVGNTLYFGDGVNQVKWLKSQYQWAANTTFASSTFINDSNNNIQVAIGATSATAQQVQITSNVCTLTFPSQVPFYWITGVVVNLSNFVTNTFLNGQTVTIVSRSYNQITFAFTHSNVNTTDTGTVSTSGGNTGSVQPTWATSWGSITVDGNQQWICRGYSVENWGITPSTTAPTVSNALRPTPYPNWVASTYYNPSLVIIDTNNNIQQLTTGGTTGGSQPAWNITTGGTTNDGSAVWTNLGTANWQANHAYSVNDIVSVTFSYWVTVTNDSGGPYIAINPFFALVFAHHPLLMWLSLICSLLVGIVQSGKTSYSYEVTVTETFKCTTAGTSGSSSPTWQDGVGLSVTDNTVTWTNTGSSLTWPDIGATANVSTATVVIDANGDLENISTAGKSGSTAPTWATAQGKFTSDGTAIWLNNGPFSGANTGSWTYSYSGLNSVTGSCSNESSVSSPITLADNDYILIQGSAFTDPQVDRIRIWRTVQNGSTRIFVDDILNPTSGTWTYQDTKSDNDLNEFIQAPSLNNIPPVGLQVLTYHSSRVWGAVANTVYYTRTSDSTSGVTTECFPPNNFFSFPSTVTRLWPCSLGLLVFTISDIYLITGSGTTSNPFVAYPFVEGIGLRSYYAFDVNGSIVYMFSSDSQLLMFDPSSGISEIGFPIGDVLSTWDSNSAYVTWHVAGSTDKALYICDGNNTVYRLSITSAPETGLMWSPKATYVGQVIGCIRSVEVTPGTHKLLYANTGNSYILQRDLSVYTDDLNIYDAFVTIGSVVLAQPGQVAEVAFITTDAAAVGSRMSIGVLLDEISGTFQSMTNWVPDPPKLVTSATTYAGRYYMNQTQNPAYCRHMMIQFKWPSEAYGNELLQYTIFGAYHQEK